MYRGLALNNRPIPYEDPNEGWRMPGSPNSFSARVTPPSTPIISSEPLDSIQEETSAGNDLIIPAESDSEQTRLINESATKQVGAGLVNFVISHLPFEAHLTDIQPDGKKRKYNFAGPGTQLNKRLDENDQPLPHSLPINALDAAAMQHDIAYRDHKDVKSRNEADLVLAREAQKVADDPGATPDERSKASLVTSIMHGKAYLGWGRYGPGFLHHNIKNRYKVVRVRPDMEPEAPLPPQIGEGWEDLLIKAGDIAKKVSPAIDTFKDYMDNRREEANYKKLQEGLKFSEIIRQQKEIQEEERRKTAAAEAKKKKFGLK